MLIGLNLPYDRIDDVEGLDSLRWEDQQRIRQYVEDIEAAAAVAVTPVENGIEVSQTSRASCKHCKQKIMKGEVTFLSMFFYSECGEASFSF